MSAYVVDEGHIRYLVHAAHKLCKPHEGLFSYYHNEHRHVLSMQDSAAPIELTPTALGQMLWNENIRSYVERYPGEAGVSYEYHHKPVRGALSFEVIDPAQVFMSCQCYEYQCCETKDWEQSEAYSFLVALRQAAARMLPGYGDCVWGAPAAFTAVVGRTA